MRGRYQEGGEGEVPGVRRGVNLRREERDERQEGGERVGHQEGGEGVRRREGGEGKVP